MKVSLIVTAVGLDRPGLVETISQLIQDYDGNWEESRLSHLGGHFAGVIRITLPNEKMESLKAAFQELGESQGLNLVAKISEEPSERVLPNSATLEIVGQDRSGIIREVSTILSRHRVNIEEICTEHSRSPLAGDDLFKATLKVSFSGKSSFDIVQKELENLGQSLMVEVSFEG